MKWDYGEVTDFENTSSGLFIINEGNFQYSNATLSFYNPATQEIENEIFYRANGMKLGDVAQSMVINGDKAWIVVNNSHVVFAINKDTYKELGRIENLTSPRYIHFISDRKAYITQLWDNRIFIVDPATFSITGYVTVPDMDLSTGSTEQMVQIGKYVYCNCWSYQNRILKIDTEKDEVVEYLTIGIQPNSIVKDKYDRLWIITDGGYEGSPFGYESPTLFCLTTEPFQIAKVFPFQSGDIVSGVNIDDTGEYLYWINDAVWKMNVDSSSLPRFPLINSQGTKYYSLTLEPVNGDLYVADAIDYSQQGMIYHYSNTGEFINSFYAGVNPGAFCWK